MQSLGRINVESKPEELSQLAHLLGTMLSFHEEDRPSAAEALLHPALQGSL